MSPVLNYTYLRVADDVIMLTYAVISSLRSLAKYGSPAYLRLWLRTPASTLPTRFPAALGIGYGPCLRLS